VTVLMGMRLFFLNADHRTRVTRAISGLALRWFGWWVLVWVLAYGGNIYFFQLSGQGNSGFGVWGAGDRGLPQL